MKKAWILLFAINLSACLESGFSGSPSTGSTSEGNLSECTLGFVTTSPCAINKSGVVVSQDFGAKITSWLNVTASTTVKANIPNGFYANQTVEFTDSNLTSANIKQGVTVFGVTGSLTSGSCAAGLSFAGVTGSTATSATRTTLQWTPVGTAYGYLVLNTTSSPYTVVTSATAGASSVMISNLSAGTNYKFRVKAISSDGLADCNTAETSVSTLAQVIPTDISNLAYWLKPESLSSLADGAPVSTWSDSSANARDFTGSGGFRPLYKANDIGTLGAVVFDGSDDELSYGNTYATDNFTVFYVATATSVHEIDAESTSGTDGVTGQKYLAFPVQSGTDGGAGVSFGTNGISVYEHGNSYAPPLSVVGGAFVGPTIVVISYSGKVASIYSGSTLIHTGLTSTRPAVHAPRYLGATSWTSFSGKVHESIAFSRTLTPQERNDIVNYLKDKFGL